MPPGSLTAVPRRAPRVQDDLLLFTARGAAAHGDLEVLVSALEQRPSLAGWQDVRGECSLGLPCEQPPSYGSAFILASQPLFFAVAGAAP